MATDEERRQRELNNAYSQKSSYETRKKNAEATVRNNNAKISRLQAAERLIAQQKQNARDYCSSLERFYKSEIDFGEWSGNFAEQVTSVFSDSLIPNYQSYITRIDEVHDELCTEITKLQNENYRLNGDITGFISIINSLMNKIRTLVN